MDVIGNYFRTLRIFLPKDQRDDILRELTEELQSHVAEREAALGRPLNADEQAAIVAQFGHPLVTAARYRPQRYLISPIVFPYYWIVLKTVLALIAAGHLIGAVLLLAGGATLGQMGQILEGAIETALKATGWITALGALADFSLSRSRALEKWHPAATFPSRGRVENVIRAAVAHDPGHIASATGPRAVRHSRLNQRYGVS